MKNKTVTKIASVIAGAAAFFAAQSALAATVTFTNPDTIVIPASGTAGESNPYPSTINVSGVGSVTDVDVVLHGFSHTFSADLVITLFGPGGQSVVLMDRIGGGSNWTNDTVTFSDGATSAVSAAPGSDGTYAPSVGLLSVFNGLDLNGLWSLFVFDDAGADVGQIAGGWSLAFTGDAVDSAVPLPAGLVLFMTGLAGLGFGARRKAA